jgi:hypothetical protein
VFPHSAIPVFCSYCCIYSVLLPSNVGLHDFSVLCVCCQDYLDPFPEPDLGANMMVDWCGYTGRSGH